MSIKNDILRQSLNELELNFKSLKAETLNGKMNDESFLTCKHSFDKSEKGENNSKKYQKKSKCYQITNIKKNDRQSLNNEDKLFKPMVDPSKFLNSNENDTWIWTDSRQSQNETINFNEKNEFNINGIVMKNVQNREFDFANFETLKTDVIDE